MRFAGAAIRTVLRIWKLFWTAVRFPLSLLWKLLRPLFSQAWHFLQKILEKPAVFFKKGLKQIRSVLYNLLNKRRSAQAEDERTV